MRLFSVVSFHGLRSDGSPDAWGDSAKFIELVLGIKRILGVRTTTKGFHKRDPFSEPVRSSDDWKLKFLRDAADFFEAWGAMNGRKGKLSPETCRAVHIL